MSAIELRGVCKSFGRTRVLGGVDLVVPDGSVTAVLGASGSGKTTMLRLIAGFDQIDGGTLLVGGAVMDDGVRAVRAQDRGVGFVPQDGALFPHLTVAGNVGFGVRRGDRSRVGSLLALVGLEGLERRYPHQLSGGQQQRVALARALAIRPRVVLMDEPFSSLDASLRGDLRRDVVRILAETGTTTVLVTHDQDEALALADQVAVLQAGRVLARAEPRDLYRRPPDLAAATSIGEANVLPARWDGDGVVCALGTLRREDGTGTGGRPGPAAADSDAAYLVLLRPEQLVLTDEPAPGTPTATVLDTQYHGHDALVRASLDDGTTVLARVPGDQVLVDGQRVGITVVGGGRIWRDGDDAGTDGATAVGGEPPAGPVGGGGSAGGPGAGGRSEPPVPSVR